MKPEKKNAIERRLEHLTDIWNEFADEPDWKMLRFLIDDDSVQMLDTFIETQNEEISDIPDLFIKFDAPFLNSETYGFSLIHSFLEQYQSIQLDISNDGIPSNWTFENSNYKNSDIESFIQCCSSFHNYYQDIMLLLVIILIPNNLPDNQTLWKKWIQNLVKKKLSSNIRFIVIETKSNQILSDLDEESTLFIKTVDPELNMQEAIQELANEGSGTTSGDRFRKIFVSLTNAASKGNIEEARELYRVLKDIAVKEEWFQMQITVLMTMGTIALSKNLDSEALSYYDQALCIVQKDENINDPATPKLSVQCMFAKASIYFQKKNYLQAAQLYESSVPFSLKGNSFQEKDCVLAIEGLRMASFCYDKEKNYKHAWDCCINAFDLAEEICSDAENQKDQFNSDLPTQISKPLSCVGELLIKLPQFTDQLENISDRLVSFWGYEWSDILIGAKTK